MQDPAGDPAPSPSETPEPSEARGYLRFTGMIVTAMAVMYAITYLNSYSVSHVRFSEERLFMTLLMGSAMALIMLGFMWGRYRNTRANTTIIVVSVLVFGASLLGVRSQATIEDGAYMSSMIPHHSIAILTSERSEISDLRVCELAVEIIEAQQREIDEMEWLIADIATNGPAETPEEAAARPVPEFTGSAIRDCPGA